MLTERISLEPACQACTNFCAGELRSPGPLSSRGVPAFLEEQPHWGSLKPCDCSEMESEGSAKRATEALGKVGTTACRGNSSGRQGDNGI